jgi:hypothetical protein
VSELEQVAPTPPWDSARVAAELGKSLDWFRRHWRGLVDKHGFPAPIAGLGAPAWHGPHVIAWKAGEYPPPRPVMIARAPQVTLDVSLPDLEREARERGEQIAHH